MRLPSYNWQVSKSLLDAGYQDVAGTLRLRHLLWLSVAQDLNVRNWTPLCVLSYIPNRWIRYK